MRHISNAYLQQMGFKIGEVIDFKSNGHNADEFKNYKIQQDLFCPTFDIPFLHSMFFNHCSLPFFSYIYLACTKSPMALDAATTSIVSETIPSPSLVASKIRWRRMKALTFENASSIGFRSGEQGEEFQYGSL
jgi:hypothetical protein